MYVKGTLQITKDCGHPECQDSSICEQTFEQRAVLDSKTDDYDRVSGVYLPHSCDEWVIGGPDQIRALIADLEEMLPSAEALAARSRGVAS